MSNDFQDVESFFLNEPNVSNPIMAEREILFYSDSNNGNYTTQIQINGLVQRPHLTVVSDMQIAIPVRVSGTAITSSSVLSFRGSVLSLISGWTFGNEQSTWFQESSGQTPLINEIRLNVNKTIEWEKNSGSEIGFLSSDEVYNGSDAISVLANPSATPSFGMNSNQLAGAGSSAVTIPASINTTMDNQVFNRSYAAGVKYFNSIFSWVSSASAFDGVVFLPLKDVIPIVAEMNFPVRNFQPVINLYCNQYTQYPPVCVSSGTAAPSVVIGPNSIMQSCQIYFPSLKLDQKLEAKINARISQGMEKKVTFLACDTAGSLLYNNSSISVNSTVSSSICAPQRVWVLPVVHNAATSANNFSPLICAGILTNFNLLVNAQVYLNQPLNQYYEQWAQIKQILPSSILSDSVAGLMNRISWQNGKKWYMIDCHRFDQNDRKLDQSVSVQVQFQRADTSSSGTAGICGSVDYYVLLERLWTLNLKITDKGVCLVKSSVTGD